MVLAASRGPIEEVDHLLLQNRTVSSSIEQGEPYPVASGIEVGQDEVPPAVFTRCGRRLLETQADDVLVVIPPLERDRAEVDVARHQPVDDIEQGRGTVGVVVFRGLRTTACAP